MKLLALCLVSAAAWAAPCTTVANCTEWVTFAGGPARSMVYRTYPLDSVNPRIARALIVIHGAGRDADNYFRTALAAAFLGGALDDTIVIAPRLASSAGSCRDQLAPKMRMSPSRCRRNSTSLSLGRESSSSSSAIVVMVQVPWADSQIGRASCSET